MTRHGATDGGEDCPECERSFPSMDHLVDHLTDEHALYDWVTRGRPITAAGGGESDE